MVDVFNLAQVETGASSTEAIIYGYIACSATQPQIKQFIVLKNINKRSTIIEKE